MKGLLDGVSAGLKALSSLVFFLAMTALSLIFLLATGPRSGPGPSATWASRQSVARTVTGRTLESLRGYFLGLTIIAVFNAVVVLVGRSVLGVPLPATLAFITFLAPTSPTWAPGPRRASRC